MGAGIHLDVGNLREPGDHFFDLARHHFHAEHVNDFLLASHEVDPPLVIEKTKVARLEPALDNR